MVTAEIKHPRRGQQGGEGMFEILEIVVQIRIERKFQHTCWLFAFDQQVRTVGKRMRFAQPNYAD